MPALFSSTNACNSSTLSSRERTLARYVFHQLKFYISSAPDLGLRVTVGDKKSTARTKSYLMGASPRQAPSRQTGPAQTFVDNLKRDVGTVYTAEFAPVWWILKTELQGACRSAAWDRPTGSFISSVPSQYSKLHLLLLLEKNPNKQPAPLSLS